jgi:pyruvate dehydrogenase complex dehydrogenase (E1) component
LRAWVDPLTVLVSALAVPSEHCSSQVKAPLQGRFRNVPKAGNVRVRANKKAKMSKADRLKFLSELERKVLWLASWMIHNANHLRPNDDGLKVGGHQASSASLATIMTALYFSILRPQDRVAIKPHASPVFHAIQYLLGNQTRDQLENFRERGLSSARSHIERLLDGVPTDCALVTVVDGHPLTLAWLGSVAGHRTRALGVEHFGQTGTIAELYRHYGIDTQSIIAAAETVSPGRPIRQFKLMA